MLCWTGSCCCVGVVVFECRRRTDELQAEITALRRDLDACHADCRDKAQQLHVAEMANRDGRIALADVDVLREQVVYPVGAG